MFTIAAAATAKPINTAKVTGRRELHFNKLADIQADAENLASHPCKQLGNWTLGFTLYHLAGGMKLAVDGAKFKVPLYIRVFALLIKKRVLNQPMKPGFQLPKNAAEELIPKRLVSTEEGLNELCETIRRMGSEPQRHPSPIFGPMTHQEWDQLQCRHAELHLSFFVPE
jgi:hypothetical protein